MGYTEITHRPMARPPLTGNFCKDGVWFGMINPKVMDNIPPLSDRETKDVMAARESCTERVGKYGGDHFWQRDAVTREEDSEKMSNCKLTFPPHMKLNRSSLGRVYCMRAVRIRHEAKSSSRYLNPKPKLPNPGTTALDRVWCVGFH